MPDFSVLYYHRARDQQATLNYLTSAKSPLFAQTNPNKAGLVGYSMGGFGALSTLGACYQFPDAMVQQLTGAAQPAQIAALRTQLNSCNAGAWRKQIRAGKPAFYLRPGAVSISCFDPKSLAKIQTPLLYVAGDQDDISGYRGLCSCFSTVVVRRVTC
ncbi:MAG: hypothetical protein U5L02_08545 [Rheinheimera sp.]|nr:hypothetical protein [Rheinheimera sp.]